MDWAKLQEQIERASTAIFMARDAVAASAYGHVPDEVLEALEELELQAQLLRER